jgi:hypothetical protein
MRAYNEKARQACFNARLIPAADAFLLLMEPRLTPLIAAEKSDAPI